MVRRALVALAVLFLGTAPARAEDTPLRLPLTAQRIPAPHTEWYGIYLNGAKVGYQREEFGRSGAGADAVYFLEQSGRMRFASQGNPVEMELGNRREFAAAAPFAFRGGRSTLAQAGATRVIDVGRATEGLSATVTEGGETRTLPLPALDYTLADVLTPERWFQTPRAGGNQVSVRGFSFEKLKPDRETYVVLGRRESVVAGVRTGWYDVKQESELNGDGGIARYGEGGRVLSVEFGGLFEGRVEPEELAKRIEYGSDLFVLGMAKIDKPIGAAANVARLVLAMDGEGAEKITDGPRQAVSRDFETGAVLLKLGDGYGQDATASPKDAENALTETVEYPTKLPVVVALAAKAVGDAKTPREKVERLVRFVADYVQDEVVPRVVSVPEIISSKRGDCSEHALLFATLARAAGVPTRQVTGLVYMGDDVKAFGGHAWNEAVIDGRWVPVDPTMAETHVDATHVAVERGGKGMDVIATLGRLAFRLIEVQRAR